MWCRTYAFGVADTHEKRQKRNKRQAYECIVEADSGLRRSYVNSGERESRRV